MMRTAVEFLSLWGRKKGISLGQNVGLGLLLMGKGFLWGNILRRFL
jgi:hypothetical protein